MVKKKKVININLNEKVKENWSKFIVISSENKDKSVTKISPFALNKTLIATAGTLKNVTKMRSGDILVECTRQQQAVNLLKLKKILELPVSVTPHRSLNSSKGIIRDRGKDLSDLSEEEICAELDDQGITNVKRFTTKKDGVIIKLTTYLITFDSTTVPDHIYIGPYRMRVDTFIPNPTRCFQCQKFGHGKNQCRGGLVCFRCAEVGHEGFECNNDIKCCNCGEAHMASSKDCSHFIKEKRIQVIKSEQNVSYIEARRLASVSDVQGSSQSYANATKKVSVSVATQTSLTWPTGDKDPSAVDQNTSQIQFKTTASTQTNTNKQPQLKKQPQTKKNNKTDSQTKKPSGPEVRPSKATRDAVQTFQFEQPINVINVERVGPLSPKPSTSKSLVSETVVLENRFDALEGMEVESGPPPSKEEYIRQYYADLAIEVEKSINQN